MKKATLYAHASRESVVDEGVKIGLSEEALKFFKFAGDEFRIDGEATENGSFYAKKIDGQHILTPDHEIIQALKWFVSRVEKGEVRSVKTYNKFKELIAKYGGK